MVRVKVTFATPEARVRYSEASLEVKARAVVAAVGILDDAFTLADALDELAAEVAELDAARASQTESEGAS